jgi:hexokinase
MPVPSAAFKQAVKKLNEKEKEAIILKAARRDAELYDLLAYELGEVTLEEVYEQTTDKLHELMMSTSGRYLGKALTKSLRKAVKEIARFKRITKDVRLETDLHLYLLRLIFDNFTGQFDSYYKSFYTATARLLLRTTQLITKNLHEDYHLEYKAELDNFLEQIHSRNKPLSFKLPHTFEVE